MSSTPRIPAVTADAAPDFGNVTAHAAEIIQQFFSLYGVLWQQGRIPADLREVTRLRNASITDCGY